MFDFLRSLELLAKTQIPLRGHIAHRGVRAMQTAAARSRVAQSTCTGDRASATRSLVVDQTTRLFRASPWLRTTPYSRHTTRATFVSTATAAGAPNVAAIMPL